jgi:hypothetical protein
VKIKKTMDCTFCKKFPDGTIFSVSFGEQRERSYPDNIDPKFLKERSGELMQEVISGLEKNILTAIEKSEHGRSVKSAVRSVKRAEKLEKKILKTEGRLKEFT